MQENPQLGNAVIDYLGEDAEKQLNMASAARNISELRADAMEAYERMIKDFHVMSDVKTYDKNNNLVMKKRPATTYSIQDVTRVALLSDIEVDMNSGEFDLENSKFADPDTIKNIIDDYAHSQVLDKFLWDTNRGDVLKDPVQMKVLFAAATDDEKMQEYLKLKQLAREQGLDNAETYMAEVNAFGVEKDEYDPNFDVHDFLDIPKLRQQSFGDDVLDQDALDESFDVHEYLNIPKGP